MDGHDVSSNLLERYALWMRAQSWSPRTIADRCELVERLGRDFAVPPEALDAEHVTTFLARGSFGSSTRRAYWMQLRSWFAWLVEAGLRDSSPMVSVPKPRSPRRESVVITNEHLEVLLATRMRRKTRAMILLAAYQGLRAFEIAKVRGSDIDLVGQTVRVVGKGDVHATLPLHPEIAELADTFPRGFWFPGVDDGHMHPNSVSDVVGDVMKRAGIPGTCHSLRHWYATELLRSGVNVRAVQKLMRHASLGSTEVYLHVDDGALRDGPLRLPAAAAVEQTPASTASVDLALEPRPLAKSGRCIEECPGHTTVTRRDTDVTLHEFNGPGHRAPSIRLDQDGQQVILTYEQLLLLQETLEGWRRY